MSTSHEQWLSIPGYGGHYEASDLGRIRVKDRIVIKNDRHTGKPMNQLYKGRILTPFSDKKRGQTTVHIGHDRKKITLSVHRAVLLAFVGPPAAGQECCHNNGNAADNRLCNLRWDTHLENNRDRLRHGTYALGEKHAMAKFTPENILMIRSGELNFRQARAELGISVTHFYRVKRGEAWMHL